MPEEVFETPQPVQPTEPKPTNWPKIILAVVLGLGLLAAAASAGYWYGIQQVRQPEKPTPVVSQPTPKPTSIPEPAAPPVEDPTKDWEAYRNTKYVYEIKYPTGPDYQELECGDDVFIFNIKGDSSYSTAHCGGRDAPFSVEIHAATGSFSEGEYPPEGDYPSVNPYLRGVSEEVVIDGVEGKKYTLTRIAPAPVPAKEYEILLQKGSAKYRIIFIAFGHENIFNLMLSTFKFLD